MTLGHGEPNSQPKMKKMRYSCQWNVKDFIFTIKKTACLYRYSLTRKSRLRRGHSSICSKVSSEKSASEVQEIPKCAQKVRLPSDNVEKIGDLQ